MLRVTNRNDFELKDRYDGKDYTFPPNKAVTIDENVATHIFGFGRDDKVPNLVRQGWMRSAADEKKAMEILGKFVFSTMEAPIDGEVLSLVDEPEPEPEPEVVASSGKKKSILDKLTGDA